MSFSQKIIKTIRKEDFSRSRVIVLGYGNMGKEYVKALSALGVGSIQVCSRSPKPLEELKDNPNVKVISGGYQTLAVKPGKDDLAIIATPVADLVPASHFLKELGFKKFLIEKPIALEAKELQEFVKHFETEWIEVFSAYNRATYPCLLEGRALTEAEGGITSCHYTFTEIIGADWEQRFPKEELACWGISNSLHVMSMAHALIGLPKTWHVHRTGNAISWHPAGSVFVGSGVSEKGIPFSFHADWGSTGRWSVEVHTKVASYRFCPLEKIFKRISFREDWKEVPVEALAPDVKVGFVEQVASVLSKEVQKMIPLYSLEKTLSLTQFGADIFGY